MLTVITTHLKSLTALILILVLVILRWSVGLILQPLETEIFAFGITITAIKVQGLIGWLVPLALE